MKSIVLLLFAGCVGAHYTIPPPPPGEKPGMCPVSDIITTCECRPENIVCNGDSECPGSQKCCSYGCDCRTRCVKPVRQYQGCMYNGVRYREGQSFPSVDGCNTCRCERNGGASCTEMACIEGCLYNGVRYREGQSFPSVDGCNTCRCERNGGASCTDMPCTGFVRDVCSLPKVVGPCRAAFRKYWYNSASRRCEKFIYGGCGGNGNNFETRAACQGRCQINTYRP